MLRVRRGGERDVADLGDGRQVGGRGEDVGLVGREEAREAVDALVDGHADLFGGGLRARNRDPSREDARRMDER